MGVFGTETNGHPRSVKHKQLRSWAESTQNKEKFFVSVDIFYTSVFSKIFFLMSSSLGFRERGRQRSRARDKKRRRFLLVEEQGGGDKMRNASGRQCKLKMSGSKKKWTRTRTTFPQKKVQLRSFWKFQVVVEQNNGKEMYKEKCAARAKLLFC